MQIGAVHAQIRRAIKTFRHRQFTRNFAGVADAIEMRERRKGDLPQTILDADAAQDLHRVRHHLDAGADAAELRGLLIDRDIDAGLTQSRGRR